MAHGSNLGMMVPRSVGGMASRTHPETGPRAVTREHTISYQRPGNPDASGVEVGSNVAGTKELNHFWPNLCSVSRVSM